MGSRAKCGARLASSLWTLGLVTSCGGEPNAAPPTAELGVASAALQVDRLGASKPDQPVARPEYTLFESGPVRPLALSPSGRTLFATNIPDSTLEVFRVTRRGLVHLGVVSVGLEPVAVAAVDDGEAWVVNHLSDSVSVVRLFDELRDRAFEEGDGPTAHVKPASLVDRRNRAAGSVVQTLHVGDEPRDIVFGGSTRQRAFITTAHRGQSVPYDPQFDTPGIGRADVWVFDVAGPGSTALGGTPLDIITLFSDTPRALAVSPDGSRVYAAGFHSGNRSTVIFEPLVPDEAAAPNFLALPEPRTNHAGELQPQTGLIVKFDGTHWVDEDAKAWDEHIRFNLPDKDVFAIDADAAIPRLVPGPEGFFAGVGTVLFNMVVNPVTGRVYVSNTDARNEHRFEGHGDFLATLGKQSLRGHLVESRITVLGGEQRVNPIHLNKHIDYARCCEPLPNQESLRSVATPLDMVVSADGRQLYLASFGTGKVAVYDTEALEANTFTPNLGDQIPVTGGGPAGLALDERNNRLYVYTRFDDAISVVDIARRREIRHIPLYNPEPESVRVGRPFLYDSAFTSSHGDSSCASCHVFGDFDSLAWDLGDPDGDTISNPFDGPDPDNPLGSLMFHTRPEAVGFPADGLDFPPLKGPMTTQSLRGLANHGPMHWRGDRMNNDEPIAQPNGGIFDEEEAFRRFNPAFEGLNGRHEPLSDDDMQHFIDFVLQITYPPNPIRALDNGLNAQQQAGRDFYFSDTISDVFFNCAGCHPLDPDANAEYGVAKPGFFGADGKLAFDFEPQVFKPPHLRNLYQKVGMFGLADNPLSVPGECAPPCFGTGESNGFMGDQVRGFGFLHDGSIDTLTRFHALGVFQPELPGLGIRNPGGFAFSEEGNQLRRQVVDFMLAFDSNLKPIVGQQVTLTEANRAAAIERVNLMVARAEARDCELVAKAAGSGFLYVGGKRFAPDVAKSREHPLRDLLASDTLGAVTFTCVPPGSGLRMGIDRDLDGVLDGDESTPLGAVLGSGRGGG